MAIFETNLDFTRLIQFTNGSLQLASFVQIRNALIERFKSIYGNDIDVSPASGDGQYINSLALLINNILQTLKQGYESLDPSIATGQYLDTLCSFNNIQRKTLSASTCQLYIYNSSSVTDLQFSKLTFVDKNNIMWVWDNGTPITFPRGFGKKYTLITGVKCNELGDISAPGTNKFYKIVDGVPVEVYSPDEQDWGNDSLYGDASINGTIYQTVESTSLRVWQYKDAEVGNIDETDEALRSRRYQMLGNASVTVLEGLQGNLLNLSGIEDVYIFNNLATVDGDQGGTVLTPGGVYDPVADGTSLKSHSIYVALRYKEGVQIDPSIVGRIIYNKLTPGISTNPPLLDANKGEFEIIRTENFSDWVYWKICSSVKPTIVATFVLNQNLYDYPLNPDETINTNHYKGITDVEKNIIKNLQDYFYKVRINQFLTSSEISPIIQQSDITKQGMSTFFVSNITINGYSSYPMNLSYLKYSPGTSNSNGDYHFVYDPVNKTLTLTIG